MSAHLKITAPTPRLADPLKVFKLRCWARAYLASINEFSFHDAIDVLQRDATASGLLALIGQDAAQEMMADAFGQFFECGP